MNPQPFFDFIQERYRIFLKKQAGDPRPWTDDEILDYYKFTNVFREDDRTTVWFRENVRDSMRNDPAHVLLATVVFRWFNRISTGEAHFPQEDMFSDGQRTAFDQYRFTGSGKPLHDACFKYNGPMGPHVTGAYIIKTPNGMTKLSGVCWALEHFHRDKYPLQFNLVSGDRMTAVVGWQEGAQIMMNNHVTLEQAWDWLRKFSYLGDFMAYEIVTDLRFTCLLDQAPDIMTWANAGPGAMRGLNRLHGRPLGYTQKKSVWNNEMRELLDLSDLDPKYWPFTHRPLEMREIEHSLCEFDKYQRVDKGEGKPRGVYK